MSGWHAAWFFNAASSSADAYCLVIGLIFGPMLLVVMVLTAMDDLLLFAPIAVVIAWVTFAWVILTAHRH